MAKKSAEAPSLSQAIRDMYEKVGQGAKPSEVVKALKEAGIEVSPGLVYQVRNKLGLARPRRGRKRGRKPSRLKAAAVVSSNGGLVVEHIIAAKKFVKEVGGASEAKVALAALARLLD